MSIIIIIMKWLRKQEPECERKNEREMPSSNEYTASRRRRRHRPEITQTNNFVRVNLSRCAYAHWSNSVFGFFSLSLTLLCVSSVCWLVFCFVDCESISQDCGTHMHIGCTQRRRWRRRRQEHRQSIDRAFSAAIDNLLTKKINDKIYRRSESELVRAGQSANLINRLSHLFLHRNVRQVEKWEFCDFSIHHIIGNYLFHFPFVVSLNRWNFRLLMVVVRIPLYERVIKCA